jgi:membrane protease YdiL (CAAX protease family)
MQLISTTFLFFLPPVFYAWICHVKPFKHLGFKNQFTRITPVQLVLVLLIILASSPVVDMLQQVTEMYPWSKATLTKFKAAEDDYFKQVMVIARMDNFLDYVISIIMVALLPAVFEETLFRGAVQNLFSRWFKMPLLAIIVTSIIFSAVHGSYLGFLSRFALGFVLGWIYYRTGNIWLNIVAHFFNNGIALTSLYLTTKPGTKMDPSKLDEHYPLWTGFIALIIIAGLFIYFDKISKNEMDRPGEEVLIPYHNSSANPFEKDIANTDESSQS